MDGDLRQSLSLRSLTGRDTGWGEAHHTSSLLVVAILGDPRHARSQLVYKTFPCSTSDRAFPKAELSKG